MSQKSSPFLIITRDFTNRYDAALSGAARRQSQAADNLNSSCPVSNAEIFINQHCLLLTFKCLQLIELGIAHTEAFMSLSQTNYEMRVNFLGI